MSAQINEIPKVFQHGETLESSELNAIIQQINTTIRRLNTVESNLDNHEYDVSIPITNIYCRTKKGINAINFFPQADAKRDELLEEVSNCSITQGIKYNLNFSTVTLSENADLMNGVWTAYPQGVNESLPHEWEVSYKKLSDNSIMYMFGPVLHSNYGYSGTDGDGVQYVYKIFDHELSDTERTNNTPTRPENPNSNGEFIPSGWSDEPLGPTSDYPYEYVATLKRTNGSWGSFEKISLWSTYTEDGANGDFQVRAFCRFVPIPNKSAPNKPIGGTYESPLPGSNDNIQWSLTVPEGQEPLWTSTRIFKGNNQVTTWSIPTIEVDTNEIDIEYSSSAERPANNTLRNVPGEPHPFTGIWHDPSENGIDLSTMVWRAERKIKNGQYNGEWVITKIVGEKGSFKSIVFRRFKPTMQQLVPAIPTGGTYNNPIPDGNLWSDGIPAGDSKIDGPIWASVRTFYGDGTATTWSEPKLQTDSEDLDIEFSPNTNQPSNPTGEPFSNREASGWYDPSSNNFNSVGPMIWRAERKVKNGQYEGLWTVTRIQGEKGEDAQLSNSQLEDLYQAGLQISVTPQTIILEQSDVLDSTHLDRIENITSNIVVFDNRTGEALTNDKYWIKKENGNPKVELYATDAVVDGVLQPLTPLSNYVNVTGADTINAKSITINNLPIVNNNGDYTYQYDKGFVRVYLEISVGTNESIRTIKIDIPWYLNKLGERIEKLKGDISETYLSRDVFTNDHTNKTIKQEFDAYINQSAKGTLEQYSLITTDAQTGNTILNVPTKIEFATYQRTASENLSALSKSVTGTNLLSDNWTTFSSPVTITSGSGVTIERRVTKMSPQIPLSEGIYILSWYSTETSPLNFKISVGTSASKISGEIPYITNNNITWQYYSIGSFSGDLPGGRLSSNQLTGYEGDYYTRTEGSLEVTYVRFYCKIVVNTKQYYSFAISTSTSSTYPVIRPQLELCLATNTEQFPTPWVPGPQDFSSEIKQTADEITFAIAGPNTTLSQFKQTFDNISSTVSNHTGQFSAINQRLDSISLEAGVSEDTLNTAGLYLTAGTPADDTTNPPTPAVPSKVRIKAGQFEVYVPGENNNPDEIIFGNEPNTQNMSFSGNIKVGYDNNSDEYSGVIRQDGSGYLAFGHIYWTADGDIYMGSEEAYDDSIFTKSGDSYNGDGLRIINTNQGTKISLQGDNDMNTTLKELYIKNKVPQDTNYGSEQQPYNVNPSNSLNVSANNSNGIVVSAKTPTFQYTFSDNLAYQVGYYNTGAICIGKNPSGIIEGCRTNARKSVNSVWYDDQTGERIANADCCGELVMGAGNDNYRYIQGLRQGIFIKGADAKIYRAYTGEHNGGVYLNGLLIGPSNSVSDTSYKGTQSGSANDSNDDPTYNYGSNALPLGVVFVSQKPDNVNANWSTLYS